ncbi:MAG: PilN domain-containing protein [Magnetococcales bacterium]|nr:PilN domain-containing protein [Magnetococcales bacterium]
MTLKSQNEKEPDKLQERFRSWFRFGGKKRSGRHKGGVFGLAQWSDSWIMVQVEESARGPLPVNICEIIPMEGDGASRLQAVLRKKGIHKCTGVGVLTPGQYRTFLEESVNAPAEEVGSIMLFRLRDRLTFPLENALVAVQPIRKREDSTEKSMVNVFVSNRDDVLRLNNLAAQLRMNLVAVDAHESALRHIATHSEEGAAKGMVLLQVGFRDAQVMAIRDAEIIYSRRIKLGIERINEQVRTTPGGGEKSLATIMEPMAMELQRTLEFLRTRMQMTVGKIRLAPLENSIAGLAEALGSLLPGVSVSPLELTGVFQFTQGVPKERDLALALPALGAALGQLRGTGAPVNLLEERLRPKLDLLSGKPILGFGLLSFLLLGLVTKTLQWHTGKMRTQFAAISSQEATIKAEVLQLVDGATDTALTVRIENQMRKMTEKISQNQQLLEFLNGNKLGQREGFSGYMEDLSRQAVQGVWLTNMTFREGGREIGFSGKGESVELVPRFIESLGRTPHFRDKRFDILQISQDKTGKKGSVGFSLRSKHIPDMKP